MVTQSCKAEEFPARLLPPSLSRSSLGIEEPSNCKSTTFLSATSGGQMSFKSVDVFQKC